MAMRSIPRTVRPGAAFALLGAVQVTLIATITLITVALPAIQADLHLDHSGLVLVSSAYGVSFGALLLLGGRLADLPGHRRVFLTGLAVFGFASAVAGLAPGLQALLAARFAQGAGAALALLGSVFPDAPRRARATAIWGVLSSAGATAGNVLSGVVITWLPWRWVFLLPVAVSAVVAAAAPRVVPAIVAAGPLAGRLIPRLGARLVLAVGLLLAAAGLLLLSRPGLPYAGLLVFPFGAGLAFSGATVAAAHDASPEHLGLIGGLVNTAMEVGPPLGLAVLVGLVSASSTDTSTGDALALRVAAAVLVLTALFALRPRGTKHKQEEKHS